MILTLSRLMRLYGKPVFIRSDDGSEFTAAKVIQVTTRCWNRPGFHRPRQSVAKRVRRKLNGKLRDELLNHEWFRSRAEVKVLIERWRQFYNERRAHNAHRYQPPATVRRAWLDSDNIDARLTGHKIPPQVSSPQKSRPNRAGSIYHLWHYIRERYVVRISRVVIRNFRVFEHLDISLGNNISCIIGENNTGKSAFLHAIRLCIDANLSSAHRSLSMRDISTAIDIGKPSEVLIGLEITDYAGKVNEEALAGAWSVEPNRARLIYRFRPRPSIRERLAVADPTLGKIVLSDYQWELQGGGDAEIDLANIDWDEDVGFGIRFSDLQAFQVVFLPALRDVESDLRQPRSSPFVKLIEASTITDAEKQKLVTALEKANDTISSSDTITKLARAVDKSFNEVAGPAFEMTIDVGLAEPTFQSVVRALRLLLSDDAVTDVDPSSNGLGVNNVLYIAILIEYFKRRLQQENSAGQLILFEEPEAHLHPQLQLSLYAALEGLPFQTILTTHSTHITAQAGLNKFVTLTNVGTGYSHSSVPSACDDLSDDDVADLERYLDATKSGLLFARKVILVEGPAELLLIPALVKQVLGRDLDREGITVVPIYGVHFDVYAKLFTKHGLPKKCAIIADGDLTPSDAAESGLSEEEAPFNAPDLARLKSKYVRVFANATTFERAVTMSGNIEMFARTASSLGAVVVATQLRRWRQEWGTLEPESDGAKEIAEKCRIKVLSTAKRYGKARFAQVAARNIAAATSIPEYIREAIEWLSEA